MCIKYCYTSRKNAKEGISKDAVISLTASFRTKLIPRINNVDLKDAVVKKTASFNYKRCRFFLTASFSLKDAVFVTASFIQFFLESRAQIKN